MLEVIFQFIRWVFSKFAAGFIIVGLGVAAFGLWLYVHDGEGDFANWRDVEIRSVTRERARVKGELEGMQARMKQISAEITAEEDGAKQADKIIDNLHDLEGTFDKLTSAAAQRKANDERIANLTARRLGTADKIAKLKEDLARATWARDGRELELAKLDEQVAAKTEEVSPFMRYAERTWNYELGREPYTLPVSTWALIALVFYFLGPIMVRLGMYFFVAPRIAGGRPVRLETQVPVLPEISESKVETTVALRPGDRLWVKDLYLPATPEGAVKKSRYMLDRLLPYTCFASGLAKLVELSHPGQNGETSVTLASRKDALTEIAFITLPEGATLVLRPSYLIGVVLAKDQKLKIRQRWEFFRWKSWVTPQFRFFEFAGPCQLAVAARRGVRVEQLLQRDDGGMPACRAHYESAMGFTPNLDYRPARVEKFWAYCTGAVPLFDDMFVGKGILVWQKVPASGKTRRFWYLLRVRTLRVFGI